MAKKKKKLQPQAEKQKSFPKIKEEVSVAHLEQEWQHCDQALEDVRSDWEEREKVFFGISADEVGEKMAKSKVYDPILSTIVIERASRVMAQPPTGKVRALDTNDKGKSLLADLILEKYIKPNANAQFKHEIKLRLWDIYSMIYGSMPMLVDYRVDDDYVGPDCWLIPIRQYYPQPGVYQVQDMDYVFVDSFVSLAWLKKRDGKYWKNIGELVQKINDTEGKKKSAYPYRSYPEEKWGQSDYGGQGPFAQVLLRTRYERDKWTTYAPDFGIILREIENPHKNNKLPVVVKETLPLLDRVVGLGEIERGQPLQYTANSLLRLYLDGVKFSIFPPTIFNPQGIVASSIRFQPGARWLETLPNSIRPFPVSPQGIQTFNNTYPFIKGALLSQAGTTETTISSSIEPALGRTPEALKQTAMRESARDNWDRKMMEGAVEELYDRFVDLIAKRQEKPIKFNLFKSDIERIKPFYPDVAEVYESGDFGEATVKQDLLANTNFRFFIESGTSMAKDTALENQALTGVLNIIMSNPSIVQAVREKGKDIDLGELIKRWISTAGIQDWEKIVVDFQPQMGNVMGQEAGVQGIDLSQFEDPAIREVAERMFGGQYGGSRQTGGPANLPPSPANTGLPTL